MLYTLIILGILVVFAFCFVGTLLFFMAESSRNWKEDGWTPTSISAHTYSPKNSIIPLRGQIVLDKATELAILNECPLILSVGHTVKGEKRTEAEMYAEAIEESEVRIITGNNPNARDTCREIEETLRICKQLGSERHLAFALAPHVGRMVLLSMWRSANPRNLNPNVHLAPVSGPFRYWVWETLMVFVHLFFPPKSERQEMLLSLIGRKG